MGFTYRWAREKEEKEGGRRVEEGRQRYLFFYLCAVFFSFWGRGKRRGWELSGYAPMFSRRESEVMADRKGASLLM